MHKDIIMLMGRLGLKNRESRIYLTCLGHKDGMFIHEITHETRIIRSTVDLTVKRLLANGFLNGVKVGRRLRYFAQSPEALLFRQKQLVEDLEQVLPILATERGQTKEMEVLYYQGAEGFRKIYENILLNMKFATKEKRDLLSFASGADFLQIFPDVQKTFINKRIKLGAWYRCISCSRTKDVRLWDSDPKALRVTKYMPESGMPFMSDILICADTVVLYSLVKPVGGAVICNQKIADSLRSLFHLVWGLLPETKTAL